MTQLELLVSSPAKPAPPTQTVIVRPSIEDRFHALNEAQPVVLQRMLELAQHRLSCGATRISAKALWEELRATLSIETSTKYKLDNSLCSRFADACIAADRRLDALIERRKRKAR